MGKIQKKDWLLATASGILLFLPFPDFNIFLLEWVAFIPLLFAIEKKTARQAYILAMVSGTIGCACGFYWFADWARIVLSMSFPVDWLGAIGHGFYAGQVFGLTILIFQWFRLRSRGFDLILFPAVLVTVFSLFPLLFPFKLGDGQTHFLLAIQAVDLVGVFGLDFMLAFVNILLFSLLQPGAHRQRIATGIAGLLLIACWFGYGGYRLSQWDSRVASWDTVNIGLIQPNRIPTLKTPRPEKGYSRVYPVDMHLSKQLTNRDEKMLVVWPEGHFYGYAYWDNVRNSFNRQIREMGNPFIIYDATYEDESGRRRFYNSSIFIDGDGNKKAKYNKIKLVPFGEYTPVLGRIPFIRDLLGDYQANLSRGKGNIYFDVMGMSINPKICYEPLFSEFTAASVAECPDGCVILVQSQDGWYGETSQPAQHTAATVLRAVENRVPVIHVINNGPSSIISPNGRIEFQADKFTRGYWMAEMPHDASSGGSFYSRHPYLFVNLVRLVFFLYLFVHIVRRLKTRK